MTIFVLIPVFNRLEHTRTVLQALRRQTLAAQLHIVVINDGSTDETAGYLAAQPDITVLNGDGNLWWGGAIQLGLEYVQKRRPTDADYVLFLNNDTWFEPEYVALLVEESKAANGAAIGSVIHEPDRDPPMTSLGARIDINRCAVWDKLSELSADEIRNPASVYPVDALSGRGTLYPARLFERYGQMRTCMLPHYMADYEVAMRFARHGVPLLVSTRAFVCSPPVYGNDVSGMSFWKRCFSRRSSSNVFYRTFFYMLVGSPVQRLTAPLRLATFAFKKKISAWIN